MHIPTQRLLAAVALVLFAGAGARAEETSALLQAVREQNHQAVRTLLQKGSDANVKSADGATPLHWAAHRNDPKLVELLLAAGANVDPANDYGVTPLALACENGSAPIVSRLLQARANPNAARITGEHVLITCARSGNADAVKALLAHGANVQATESWNQQTALMVAAGQRHSDVVKILIEAGADIRARSADNVRLVATTTGGGNAVKVPRGGFTPLLFAARSGDIASAKLLLAAGADVNEAAPDGNSVLVVAAHSGHTELAAFLLEQGADPNADGAGYTALHAAVLRGDIELAKALLKHGAKPNVTTTAGTPVQRFGQDYVLNSELTGATPFFLAAKFVELELMRLLLEAGADPLLPCDDGTTPLMAAAGYGWNGNEDRRGRVMTPAEIQAERLDGEGTLAAVQMIVERGADVNGINSLGNSALHAAASQEFPGVVRYLVEKGARVDLKNYKDQTPLAQTKIHDQVGRVVGELKTASVLKALGATDE